MADTPRLSSILARISDTAVLKATGRDWSAWLALLDEAGAKAWPHREIAEWLAREQQVPSWWAQMVAVAFEQSRGLRAVHEKTSGFAATISRTLDLPLDRLYAAFTTEVTRNHWAREAGMQVQRATANKSLRLSSGEGGKVDVRFSSTASGKTQIAIEHDQLAAAADVPGTRAGWRALLDELVAEYRKLG